MKRKEIYDYNPERDRVAVSQSDVLDLKSAFINGMLPENVSAPDVDYDNNEEPEKIIGRPANEFEAIHMVKTIKDLQSASKPPENGE